MIAALIVLFMVVNSINAGNVLPVVYTMPVTRGDVEQIVSTSGTVKTEESKLILHRLQSKSVQWIRQPAIR